jgi:hypothetical protein
MIQNISKRQLEFFVGCMLGDGNMKIPKGCVNAMFQCQHGPRQYEYNKYKSEILESLGSKFYEYKRKTPNKKTGEYYECNMTITNCNPEITEMYNLLYKNKKKTITKELLEHFTAFSLAVLFMDDGSLSSSDEINTSYIIASCNFSKESLDLFQTFLFDKFNIETTISKDNRIYIKVNSRNLFEYLIKPHIVPCMMYKIRKMSRNSVNCLGSPEEGNQQPSSCGDTEKGSTTSSESQVDNNSTTKAEHQHQDLTKICLQTNFGSNSDLMKI